MSNEALIFAMCLDGKGGGRPVAWEEVGRWQPEDGLLWVHMNYNAEETHRWLEEQSGLDPVSLEAMTAEETRPRCVVHGSGMLVILRGVNLNPGAEPEDMVSVRAWIEPGKIITIRHRRLMALEDIRLSLVDSAGPCRIGEFLVELCDHISQRMASVLAEVDDSVDALEVQVLDSKSHKLRVALGNLRRQTIRLRRYLAPQREAMVRLQGERVDWLDDTDRGRLREVADRTTRYVEELDSARDRAAIIQDDLESRLGEQMNRTMYLLSLVAAIFLPLGLLTGLLGINVGGIPGSDNPMAFLMVCGLLLVVVVLQLIIFRRKHWL
ncbi:zinc transporter ZntB [Trichloromonas sp.]|uniref:zinc transporter ZntB n=1 Tax=Trichloromonas sp. TaxID=3069249 RepID=UPI003D8174C1